MLKLVVYYMNYMNYLHDVKYRHEEFINIYA